MQTNLDKLFLNSEKCEKEGIWFNISDTTGFLVKRFGGMNSPEMKKAVSKHFKPYAYQIEKGTMDIAKEREILTKIFVEACILDWKGIEIDGKEEPFSVTKCISLLVRLPELCDSLKAYAEDGKNYREELGNS